MDSLPSVPQVESAPFYDELMAVLDDLRAERPAEGRFTFRNAVVQGLGLADSFTGKIKSGAYKPSAARLERLAEHLGIHPSRFPTYASRLAREAVASDQRFVELFRRLATLDRSRYDQVVKDMLHLVSDAAKTHPDAQ